jgi:hypothetical protein
MLAVSITIKGGDAQMSAHELFPVTLRANSFFAAVYDGTPDGKKFVVESIGDSMLGQTLLNLVVNWQVLLKR